MRRLPVWNFYPGGTFTLVELLPGWNFYPGWNFCLGGTFTLVELLPGWNFYLDHAGTGRLHFSWRKEREIEQFFLNSGLGFV